MHHDLVRVSVEHIRRPGNVVDTHPSLGFRVEKHCKREEKTVVSHFGIAKYVRERRDVRAVKKAKMANPAKKK